MSATNSSRELFRFSDEDSRMIESAFEQGIEELNRVLSPMGSVSVQSNNHFDEAFHAKLVNGDHLKHHAA
jgi:hypothetical protein